MQRAQGRTSFMIVYMMNFINLEMDQLCDFRYKFTEILNIIHPAFPMVGIYKY